MKKKKFKTIEMNKMFISLVDTMIPESKSELMPNATKAIKISTFLKNILKNIKLKKKLIKFSAMLQGKIKK